MAEIFVCGSLSAQQLILDQLLQLTNNANGFAHRHFDTTLSRTKLTHITLPIVCGLLNHLEQLPLGNHTINDRYCMFSRTSDAPPCTRQCSS